jgi:hypothetical protein
MAGQELDGELPSVGLLFWKEQFETVCFNSFILKRALKWAWSPPRRI